MKKSLIAIAALAALALPSCNKEEMDKARSEAKASINKKPSKEEIKKSREKLEKDLQVRIGVLSEEIARLEAGVAKP